MNLPLPLHLFRTLQSILKILSHALYNFHCTCTNSTAICHSVACGGWRWAGGTGLCSALPFGLTVGRFCFPFAVCLSSFLPFVPCAYAKHIAAHYLRGINMLSLARAGASCCSSSSCLRSLLLPLRCLLLFFLLLLLLLLLMNLLLFLLLLLLIFVLRLLWFYVAHSFLFFCQTRLGNPSKGAGETVAGCVPCAVLDVATNSLQ